MAESPTPPHAMTRTLSPGRTFARRTTDSTPVVTPHPSRHVCSAGSPAGSRSPRSPGRPCASRTRRRTRGGRRAGHRREAVVPSRSTPWSRAYAAPVHRLERPSKQYRQLPQAGEKVEDDVLADARRVDALPDRVDHAGALVAQHHRQRHGPLAVHVGQVGAADAGGQQPHAHLVAARRVEVELAHLERLVGLDQDGGADADRLAHATSTQLMRPPAAIAAMTSVGRAQALAEAVERERRRVGQRRGAADQVGDQPPVARAVGDAGLVAAGAEVEAVDARHGADQPAQVGGVGRRAVRDRDAAVAGEQGHGPRHLRREPLRLVHAVERQLVEALRRAFRHVVAGPALEGAAEQQPARLLAHPQVAVLREEHRRQGRGDAERLRREPRRHERHHRHEGGDAAQEAVRPAAGGEDHDGRGDPSRCGLDAAHPSVHDREGRHGPALDHVAAARP